MNDFDDGDDVRQLDEVTLHRAVLDGDREAFAELMDRHDAEVRGELWCAGVPGSLDDAVAEFWIGLLREPAALATWLATLITRDRRAA